MRALFEALLYQPIFNIFVGAYNIIPDVGVVIIILTVLIKLALYPLTKKSIKAQKSLSELQPRLEELKKKYKDDQQQLAQETMKLYKEHKVNPLGSCLPILIQLPIFLALYWVLRAGLASESFDLLYPFVSNPEQINPTGFGLIDLSRGKSLESLILGLLAGIAQWWQSKMMFRNKPPKAAGKGGKDEGMAAMMNKQMLYFMPAITVLIGYQLPGGLALYWLLSTLLTGLQQLVVFKKNPSANTTPTNKASESKQDKKDNVVEGKLKE